MYRRIIYKAGATREIVNCYPRGKRKGVERILLGKKTSEEIQEANSTYNMNDVINAIQNGNDYTRVYKKIVEEKQEEAKKEGTKFDEKSVTSSLKSRLTATYKEVYVGGSQAERQKIRTTLYKVRINGKQLYSDDDFKDWIKSTKKK